ncbi:MAG TPA: hypothetical protein VFQ21_03955 [Gemmatimonadota bacterium]|nr:hypothetical protein [Gemmatimonadota bacterium]
MIRTAVLALAFLCAAASAVAQTGPRASDVESPEAIVLAAYAAIAREPGQPFDWERFRSLFLPEARLVPNTEQRQGAFDVLSPEEFIVWIDGVTPPLGGENDRGFQEEQVSAEVVRYGDVAHVFSTYQKHFWRSDQILGRGINSFQLVHDGERWWIAGIAWDEESGAGPIPPEYLP